MRISEKPPGFTTAFAIQTKPRTNKTEHFFRVVCPLGGLKKGRQVQRATHCLHLHNEEKRLFLKMDITQKEHDANFLPQEVAALLLQHRVMSPRTFLSVSSVVFCRLQTLLAMKELFCSLASSAAENIFTPVWRFLLVPSFISRLVFWVNRGSCFFSPFRPNCRRVMKSSAALRDQRRVRHFCRFSAVYLEKILGQISQQISTFTQINLTDATFTSRHCFKNFLFAVRGFQV